MSNIEFINVNKQYKLGEIVINAAKSVNFHVKSGELVTILGPSGAGKTTVLNLLGGMDRATSGKIRFGDVDLTQLNDKNLSTYRRHNIGFVFQFYNLMPNLTALENVELAKQVCKNPLDPKEVLERVGLGDRIHNFPAQLSGGEQQRVAIARALCKNPDLLLCDEPTGALDTETGKIVLEALYSLSREMKKTVLIITHNTSLAPIAGRLIEMKNGTVVSETVNANPKRLEEIQW